MSMRGSLRLPMTRSTCPRRSWQRGSALVEYTVVVLVLVTWLIAKGDVVRQLAEALRDAYAAFVYALSISWA